MWTLVWIQVEMFGDFAHSEKISFKYTETWSLICKSNKTSENTHIHTHICEHAHIHTHIYKHIHKHTDTCTNKHMNCLATLRDPTETHSNIPKYSLEIVRQQNIGKYHLGIWKCYFKHCRNFKFLKCELVWMRIERIGHFERFQRISFEYNKICSRNCKSKKTSENFIWVFEIIISNTIIISNFENVQSSMDVN